MMCRERRSWTEEEDDLLRNAVKKEDPDGNPPSKWHQIAKHVPNRTNKDCRKRWFAKMASIVSKGGWSTDEDERLIEAVRKHGTRWSLVAAMVQTRNNDQCAKRWSDTLNPDIDRTVWSPEEDTQLLDAVQTMGKSWTKIVKTYFPGRTGLSAKNRPAVDPSFPCIPDVPECPPTSALSTSLEGLAFPTADNGDMKVAVGSVPPEFLNMASHTPDSSTSPSTSSESCPSLDALMNELSASMAFDSLTTHAGHNDLSLPLHSNLSDSNLFDPQCMQMSWPAENLASSSAQNSFAPTPQSLPGSPFDFSFSSIDGTFPGSFSMAPSPASPPSVDTMPSPSSATSPSSTGILSPITPQSTNELDQQQINSHDDLMAMLQGCSDVADFQMAGPNGLITARVDQSRNENRMAVAVAVAIDMDTSQPRQRKLWTDEEDRILRAAVYVEDPESTNKKWNLIAKHLPGRNNRDCRKRWHNQMSSLISKGPWTPEENERLMQAVSQFGTKWSQVAAAVKTRNGSQCAKRWYDKLDPSIRHESWTADEVCIFVNPSVDSFPDPSNQDTLLFSAVERHGRVWSTIVSQYFPGRTGLDAKNRYTCLTRKSTRERHSSIATNPDGTEEDMSAAPNSTPSGSYSLELPFAEHYPPPPSYVVRETGPSPNAPDSQAVPDNDSPSRSSHTIRGHHNPPPNPDDAFSQRGRQFLAPYPTTLPTIITPDQPIHLPGFLCVASGNGVQVYVKRLAIPSSEDGGADGDTSQNGNTKLLVAVVAARASQNDES
ncbi:hypothetical protein CCMSSC00406_0007658 [Pleurotus cornucopiae]|uniref:Uncharacterized protein n=1 Tax=Pleurotus cornucopiae TaxID=5321 RepID=A0ACB7J2M4_PLECO|nr:hypothetical protein CCMSSC00406_0007658 [Pleurotus cornucopiae]